MEEDGPQGVPLGGTAAPQDKYEGYVHEIAVDEEDNAPDDRERTVARCV